MRQISSRKPEPGGTVPLFDRLEDDDPTSDREEVCLRVYDRDEVLASIQRELDRLFNTRSNLPMSRWHLHQHTAIDYGLPDYAHLSPRHGGHRDQMARIIEQAIADYEPRLREVRLTPLTSEAHQAHRFRFTLDGSMVIGDIVAPVSFPIDL